MRRVPKLLELNALSITLFYLIFATLWILLSDQFLIWLTNDSALISRYQTLKGLFYVFATAAFLYYLINLSNKRIANEKVRIDRALEANQTATWYWDVEKKRLTYSRHFHMLFGFRKKPISRSLKSYFNTIHEDDIDCVVAELEKIAEGKAETFSIDFRVQHKDGSWRWLKSQGSLISKEVGQTKRVGGVLMDITSQKELEERYAREKELFESIFQNIPIMIDVNTKDVESIRVNKAYEEITGWFQEEIREKNIMENVYPDPEMRKKAEHAIEQANGEWNEFEMWTKGGEKRIQQWANIRLSDGKTVGIGLDITELKQKERELKELNERYKNAENLAKIGHWKRNLKTNRSVVSTGFYEIVEVDPKEETITYQMLKKIIHKDDWHHFMESVEDGVKNGTNDFYYRVMGQRSGKVKHIHELGRVDYDEQGEPEILSGTIQDITDELEYQQKLQEITERYRRAEEIADFGHWERNVQTDEAVLSQGFYDVIGLTQSEDDTSYEALLEIIHPDDREYYDEAFKEALKTGFLNVRYRLIKPSTGKVGYYHELAQTEYDAEGNPLFISGTIQDTTEREQFQIKLKRRNDFIETTLENLPIGVAVNLIDTGETTLMNSKFSEIYGWPKKVLKDVETFFEKIYPDENYRRKMVDMVRADMASRDPERMEWQGIKIITSTGENRIINAKNIPVYDQNLMISTVVDVTAQTEAEEKLAESEHNYRLLFQKSPQPMWIFNPENYAFIEVNNAAVKHYGYSRKEFQEMTILDIRPESDLEEVRKSVEHSTAVKLDQAKEWQHIKKNGNLINVTITGSDIDYFGNRYRLILVNDITKQKRAEAMVLSSLVEGENKERARIARELHDGLGQYLAAANMNFDALKKEIEKLDDRRQKQFKKGLTLLKHAVTETAQISRNLLPRVVDDYGLAPAIEALIDNYSSNTDIEITYYHNIDELKLPRKVELNLYRIAQEGISNAVKYAEATQINVQLIKDELDLILSIDDNGKGFELSDPDFKPGLGLQTIKTRTGALSGELELDSQPGKGTFLHIIVPVQQNI